MRNLIRGIQLIALYFCFITIVCHAEHITNFDSHIQVMPDSTLRIHETIAIVLPTGRHGIFRDFPTHYKDRWNINHKVHFDVQSVTHNGKPITFLVSDFANGKRIRIGDAGRYLPVGSHRFEIEYSTNRQLGFFENHDELYWNVTGNGWPFAIDHATALVELPKNITVQEYQAYTGYQGQQEQSYMAQPITNNSIRFENSVPLLPYQGLTIVVTWPKGHIQPPSMWMLFYYFIKDNIALLWLILGMLFLIGYIVITIVKTARARTKGTIIPLFYPPKGFMPGAVRYLENFGYDSKVFASEIINMAVHGFITIEYKRSFFKDLYTFKKTNKGDAALQEYYQPLLDALFAEYESITVAPENQSFIARAIAVVRKQIALTVDRYFDFHTAEFGMSIVIAIAVSFGFFLIGAGQQLEFLLIALFLMILFIVYFYYELRGYTKQGQKLFEDVQGFKLFLATTETERMKIIGTPPTRTPELYEKYLPYAVALGVEKQWSAQFAPIFDRMQQEGHPYIPVWYIGPMRTFRAENFATGLGNSLSTSIKDTISSSGIRPGSVSGSGGRGSSGGGGGGGGGGTW